ncbi:enoyl-CoA hydratase/isomerase family protein [Nocardia sp. NPDC051570]|uniref:enoyl-CoA hydratase/isomerase family protein n=1 Tax=Nocardia sp. NPDC051570 TaxID=3364324 RepID=UPI0037A8473C
MNERLPTIRTRQDGGVLWARFDNPPINLVGPQTLISLNKLVDRVEDDDSIRVVVFESANPEFFLAHWDMTAVGAAIPAAMPSAEKILGRLPGIPKVSIAKIAGRARGIGSEVALACDLRFASAERAILSQLEIIIGALPGSGGTQMLPRLMGRGRALEALLGGEDFPAQLAERYGWINRALPDAELDDFVDRLAHRIASLPSEAIAAVKAMVDPITLPAPAELAEESERFREALGRPDVAARIGRLMQQGMQTSSGLELDFGSAAVELLTPETASAAHNPTDR